MKWGYDQLSNANPILFILFLILMIILYIEYL
jgi:hypothetical protein